MGKKNETTEGTAFETASPSPARTMLGPLDIQQKEFRVARFGGYKMRDVDEFLDTVTDSMSALVAEVDRLRKGAPVVGAPDLADVSRQADEIIERARTEAARIVAEAKVQGSAGTSAPADKAAVNAFLVKEREFLQSLAGLVQGHAETVKGMSKATRKPAAAATAAPAVVPAEAAPTKAAPTKAAPTKAEPVKSSGQGSAPAREAAPAPEATAVQEPVAAETPTRVPESDAAVRVGEPEPAAAAREEDPADGDRSLRDLFWGED